MRSTKGHNRRTMSGVVPDQAAAEREVERLLRAELIDDPYGLYGSLLARPPLWLSELGVWVLSSHRDVNLCIRDRRFGRAQSPAEPARASLPFGFLMADPPDHTRLRGQVSRWFTPRAMRELDPTLSGLAARLLSEVEGRDFDVVTELAYPFALRAVGAVMGVPDDDDEMIRDWVKDLVFLFEPYPPTDRVEAANRALAEATEYLRLRLSAGGPASTSLLSEMATLYQGDGQEGDEILSTLVLLLMAGHETTVNLISNGVHALLEHPAQYRWLCADPNRATSAIDELLRFDPPVQILTRVAQEALRFGDTTVHAGQSVVLLLGAANRDPKVFPNPDRIDLARVDSAQHVSFGGGMHHCLGASLARSEGRHLLEAIATSRPRLRLARQPERRRTCLFRGFAALPVQ
jgi:cytochrome P450